MLIVSHVFRIAPERVLYADPSSQCKGAGSQTITMAFIIRLGESEDCAGAVSFMCSDDARYMTGETIVVSGGMQCRL